MKWDKDLTNVRMLMIWFSAYTRWNMIWKNCLIYFVNCGLFHVKSCFAQKTHSVCVENKRSNHILAEHNHWRNKNSLIWRSFEYTHIRRLLLRTLNQLSWSYAVDISFIHSIVNHQSSNINKYCSFCFVLFISLYFATEFQS